ncbi:MAG: DNA-binding response regulator [Anaerocolumna sp.]|jgi:DNA-binding response OmpR family regulator|nr:DNA-binding response regulator [Anaerocolumna sp.]
MNPPKKIIIIEDEKDIIFITKNFLITQGYEVYTARSLKEAKDILNSTEPDFVILDLMLPDGDGIEFCQSLREKSNVTILILSARANDIDKILGLGFGADDYMTKPFSLNELAARIQAHLRRMDRLAETVKKDEIISFGKIKIDKKAYSVWVDGELIMMPAKEFELLHFMTEHKNQVFTKSQLLDAVWGYEAYGDENTIAVYMNRLRDKIEENPSQPIYIKTVWGVGYKFSWKE